jgi:hypothetical protein
MVTAAESSGTGNAAELQAVSYTSLISRALVRGDDYGGRLSGDYDGR